MIDKAPEGGDDAWLSQVGNQGWFVLTQDHRYHLRPSESFAIRQHQVGCFYLWGQSAARWETARSFMLAAPAIVEVADSTVRPFIFRVDRSGRFVSVPLP